MKKPIIAAITIATTINLSTIAAAEMSSICKTTEAFICVKSQYEKTTFFNETVKNENDTEIVATHIDASKEEIYEVARVLQHECCGFGDEGRYLVATTIANRVVSEQYPDSVWDVIMQKGQYGDGKGKDPCPDCIAAAEAVFNNDVRALPAYVLNFQSYCKGYWDGYDDYCMISQGKYTEYFCFDPDYAQELTDTYL